MLDGNVGLLNGFSSLNAQLVCRGDPKSRLTYQVLGDVPSDPVPVAFERTVPTLGDVIL